MLVDNSQDLTAMCCLYIGSPSNSQITCWNPCIITSILFLINLTKALRDNCSFGFFFSDNGCSDLTQWRVDMAEIWYGGYWVPSIFDRGRRNTTQQFQVRKEYGIY